jgi:hypothetical protein
MAYHVATVNASHTNTILPTSQQPQYLPKYFANAIVDPDTGQSLEYRHLIKYEKMKLKWTRSFANELGRLAQGVAY